MAWILLIIQLLPSILKLIVEIEGTFKSIQTQVGTTNAKLGPVKKQLIMDAISSVGADSKTTSTVSTIIDKSVTTLNTIGFSGKETSPQV